ncbi:endonuclease/exonuclease/phosphatase family protein [Kitasatospora sp. NPDC056327]|uniref:endonuclease/exonuclease/phosphatase family protein n=1 Tax=Kitasatospora sp. NPDC056327 TaxID=3345785 RepID=UPI0035E2F6B2
MKRFRTAAGLLAGLLLPLSLPALAPAAPLPAPALSAPAASARAADGTAADGVDLSVANRTGPPPGLPDWSRVGFRGGRELPRGDAGLTGDATCRISPDFLAAKYRVVADDGADDTAGLQRAIDDIRSRCSPTANFDRRSLIELPAGRIDVSRQIYVDADHLVLRGRGSGAGGTRLVFRPDLSTRYDTVVNGRWDQDSMVAGTGVDVGTGGWMWPGRGLFRVQTRDVADRYKDDWEAATTVPMRKDVFEGSVNQHWVSGVKVAAQADDPGYSARQGSSVVRLDPKADTKRFRPGGYVWVGAANSRKFYAQQGITDPSMIAALHMRQQMFRVLRIDATAKTVTLDRPLEWDLPVNSESDGSEPLNGSGTPYASKVTPLKVVEGVGFEDFAFTQEMEGLPKLGGGTYSLTPAQAVHNYGNLAPEYAMHGIVFKWAANGWARGLKAEMTGSHPIVTEVARNLQIEGNTFDGAWNKGKGGNGYLRGSRVWDSLWALNVSRNLRHFTFQWSASGNVAFRNDLDSDLNLHGGWEHNNLFEQNTVRIPYEHRSANCAANCGGEGGETDEGTWYPIWWAAGPKAGKWSGSSGPQNVFYNNTMVKQTTPGGPFEPYAPYGVRAGTAFQFGSDTGDPRTFRPLGQGGRGIPDWTGRETLDYQGDGLVLLDAGKRHSLFLRDTGGVLEPRPPRWFESTALTWNMQGSSGEHMTDKWNAGVAQLEKDTNADVVALQESGAPPGRGASTVPITIAQTSYRRSDGEAPPVEEYQMAGMRSRGGGFVYRLKTVNPGQTNGRTSLAIWSRRAVRDQDVHVVPGRVDARGRHPDDHRPALGIKVCGLVYFTLHGDSSGGSDTAELLNNIRVRMSTAGPGGTAQPWIALGDYNRGPGSLATLLAGARDLFHISGAHPATRGNNLLDYAVTDRLAGPVYINRATTLTDWSGSDHLPAAFDLAHVTDECQPAPTRVAKAVPAGRRVAVQNAASLKAARPWNGGANSRVFNQPLLKADLPVQGFQLEADPEYPGRYRLLHRMSSSYLGLASPVAGSPVTTGWEDRGPSQLWRVVDQGDGTWVLHNAATDQVLTAVDTPEGEELAGRAFDPSDPRQRWFLPDPEAASVLQEIDLEDATPQPWVLNVDDGATADGTPVNVRRDSDAPSERFGVIPADRTAGDDCYYLTYGGKYVNSTAAHPRPLEGAKVTLNSFRPDDDGYLWCATPVGGGTPGVYLSNHTAPGERLYLETHGEDVPLTVGAPKPPGGGPSVWRFETVGGSAPSVN